MSWLDEFDARLADLDRAQLRRRRRVVVAGQGPRMVVDGRPMLAFCSNDYLGLAGAAQLRQAVHEAVDVHGVGSTASPMVCGHSSANDALERELAEFVRLPRALYFYAGYATNASIVPALVGPGDALFSDALNHACLIDGARLSRARIHRYAHADLDGLAALLKAEPARRKLILSDTVFSMDGDTADLRALLALAQSHDALVLVDDAHGLGVLGPQGRGALAAAGLDGESASPRLLYMATLGKAVGVAGAFVAGPERIVEWLLQKTRSYTYATAAPALLAEAVRASLQLVTGPEGDARRARLQGHVRAVRAALAPGADAAVDARGWHLAPSSTPVQPLVVGTNRAALDLMAMLEQRGLWVPAIRPPTVPPGSARLRIALSAGHTADDVAELVAALHDAARAPGRGA